MTSTNVSTFLSPPTRRPPSPAPRVWAGAVLLLSALVCLGLGGCFLIGVLSLLRPELFIGGVKPASLSPEEQTLLVTLYAFAFACFLAALILFCLGLRGLWRVLRGGEE
jgi:hypothetical protein